ncbi:MAG: helix-turn-helix domain-containing protein [Bifidobacteriaceae bacterium]|jgi:transcriptional regulator with XRE-family HTH domain|nr:helix-turn-helix domain-containing protein [Bifidobacteriaceae bacterium]
MATSVHDAAQLGAAVRAARIDHGLSQTDLAHGARVGRQWLVGLEAGDKVSAPLDMVLRVLGQLRLSVTLDPTPAAFRPTGPAPPLIRADDIVARYTDPNPR